MTRVANQILRPAVSFGAIAALLALMAWAIGGISNEIGEPASSETVEASPSSAPFASFTPEGSVPPGLCLVTTITTTDVFDEPNRAAAVREQLGAGQIVPVTGHYIDSDLTVWLFVRPTEYNGWLAKSEFVVVEGDCGQLPLFVKSIDGSLVTATLAAVVANATEPAVGTNLPPATQRPVCDVVAPRDVPLYSGPDYGYRIIGTLSTGTQIPVLSWVKGNGTVTWLNVGFDDVSSGWVTWQNVDMAQLCPFVAQVTPIPVTPTSAEPCVVEAAADVPVLLSPFVGAPQVGTMAPGEVQPVTGQYYVPNYDTWFQIYYQGATAWVPSTLGSTIYTGVKGNCAAVPYIDIQPAPATHTATPDYFPSPTPTLQPTNNSKCSGSTTVDGLEVFVAPAYSSAVVGTLSQGTAVTVIDAYYGGDSNNWLKVEYTGGSGWITSGYTVNFVGPCGNIPPTPITPISVPIDYTAGVALAVGSTSQFTQTLPGTNGDRAHVIAVKVENIPQGNSDTNLYRTVRMQVNCSGASAASLRWGYFGNSSLTYSCGQYIDINMGMGWNSQYYVFQIPPDGSVTYTISLTVNPYAGP